MLEDARQWLNSKQFGDIAHTKVDQNYVFYKVGRHFPGLYSLELICLLTNVLPF